jgi:dihydropyrimidinase
MNNLNIINGNVVFPEIGVIEQDISIKDGKISSISQQGKCSPAKQTINAKDLTIIPGIIDPHVHLGFCQGFKEDFFTETQSSLIGGVTTIGDYISGTTSYLSTMQETEDIINKNSFIDVFPHICIHTEEQKQEIQSYFNKLGLSSFKFYMYSNDAMPPSQTNSFILTGLREVVKCGKHCLSSIHAEDKSILADEWKKFFQAGKKSLADWAAHNPPENEVLAVTDAATLAELSGSRVNVVHVSTAAGAARLKSLMRTNHLVTAETLELYLSLNSASEVDPEEARWSPAVRGPEDQEALWRGVKDGTLSTIGTDQACVTREGNRKFVDGFGVSGSSARTALLLSIVLTEGHHKRGVPLLDLVAKMTLNPARLWGLYPRKGTVITGADADLVLVDVNGEFTVDCRKLRSASDWALHQGRKLRGLPVMTIKDGEIVMRDGEIIPTKGTGKMLRAR